MTAPRAPLAGGRRRQAAAEPTSWRRSSFGAALAGALAAAFEPWPPAVAFKGGPSLGRPDLGAALARRISRAPSPSPSRSTFRLCWRPPWTYCSAIRDSPSMRGLTWRLLCLRRLLLSIAGAVFLALLCYLVEADFFEACTATPFPWAPGHRGRGEPSTKRPALQLPPALDHIVPPQMPKLLLLVSE